MSNTNQICPICGGKKTKGKTTFSADVGSGVVVVREVEATICLRCGEEWIDHGTARATGADHQRCPGAPITSRSGGHEMKLAPHVLRDLTSDF